MATQNAHVHGNRNTLVQVSGSGHKVAVNEVPYITLIPVERRIFKQPNRDIQLLDPAYRATPLIGRQEDLNDLHLWLQSKKSISIRTLIGPAGAGKTRLALEFLLELQNKKGADDKPLWDAGFLTVEESSRFMKSVNLSAWEWQKPTLIVVDYASTMASELGQWVRALSDSSYLSEGQSRNPFRLLLLERHANTEDGWYSSLITGGWHSDRMRDLFDTWEPIPLRSLESISDRYTLFRAGLEWATRLQSNSTGATSALEESQTPPAERVA